MDEMKMKFKDDKKGDLNKIELVRYFLNFNYFEHELNS